METLQTYIQRNRENISPVTTQEQWYGEMYHNTRAIFYDVPTMAGKKRVFAFVSYPTTAKPANGYPAVVLIHGGNGAAFYEMSRLWADRGFVTITPDFDGKYAYSIHDRQRVNEDGGNPGYSSMNDLHEENPWAYFSVLSAMRALDVLQSIEDVDKDNLFSCGLSWGGFVQLLLSSVETRLKGASVIYSSAFVMQSKWGQDRLSVLESEEEKQLWTDYVDPHNYLQNITHPVFFTAGADDSAFTMENRRLTAEKIPAPTYFGLRKNFLHGNFIGFEQRETCYFFMNRTRGGAVPQPEVTVENGSVTIVAGGIQSTLSLCYTKDSLTETDMQTWEEIPVASKATVAIPKDTTAFFVVEKGADGLVFSSNLIRV